MVLVTVVDEAVVEVEALPVVDVVVQEVHEVVRKS